MRARWLLLAFTLGVTGVVAAQEPIVDEDTGGAELLRAEVERRVMARIKVELSLTDDQMSKLQATQDRIGPRRRQLMREWVGYQLALQRQMRPGVAANGDSVRVAMDGQQRVRAAQLALEDDERREWSRYLTPVQVARLQFIRQRILDRANELRRARQERLGGQRPVPRPRRRP